MPIKHVRLGKRAKTKISAMILRSDMQSLFSRRLTAAITALGCIQAFAQSPDVPTSDAARRAIDLAQEAVIHNLPLPKSQLAGFASDAKVSALTLLDAHRKFLREQDAFISPNGLAQLGMQSDAPGTRCADALPLSIDQPFAFRVSPKAEIWFRVVNTAEHIALLDTVGSHADTALEVFLQCGAGPIASADDTYGLQARLSLPKAPQSRTYYVRLRSLSAQSALPLRLQLRAGAMVSGQVFRGSTGAALSLAATFFDAQKRYLGSDFTDSNGRYELAVPENVSSIFVRTQKITSPEVWLNGVYPSGICRDQSALEACVLGAAQPIATAPNTVSVLNPMTLREGASLAGTISVPNTFLSGSVHGLSAVGAELFSAGADSVGRFRIDGLFPDTVRIYARASGALSAVHPNIPCTGPNFTDCPLSQATPVQLQQGATSRIDFALQSASGIYIQSPADISAFDVFRANGTLVANFQSVYASSLFVPLAPGSYKARLRANSFFPSVWPAQDCVFPCLSELSQATPFTLASGEIKSLPFNLRRLPEIRVTMRDQATQLPIDQAESKVLSQFGPSLPVSAINGVSMHKDLEPGQYYVSASSPQYVDQASPGVVCEVFYSVANACPGAQPIQIDLSSPSVIELAFNLTRSGAVQGRNRNFSINVLNTSGDAVGYSGIYSRFADNQYRVSDIAAGTYLFGTSDYRYFPQLFSQVNCPISSSNTFTDCAFAAATPVQVSAGNTALNIDFQPRANSAIRGTLVNQDTGAPISGVILDFWQASPNTPAQVVRSVRSDAQGKFEVSLSAPAWLSSDQAVGFINQVYPNLPCFNGSAASGACAATAGQLITPDTSLNGDGIVMQLQPLLFQNGFEN
jgi:hypothetical protein